MSTVFSSKLNVVLIHEIQDCVSHDPAQAGLNSQIVATYSNKVAMIKQGVS